MSYMVDQALKRPPNYNALSSEHQWAIDRQLGILDWDPTPEERQEFTRRWTQLYAPPPPTPPDVPVADVPKPVSLRKETILEGYFATGDYEAFCFDKHDGPAAHEEAIRPSEPKLDNLAENSPEERSAFEAWQAWDKWAGSCRVYPHALLPAGTHMKKGRWKITVEFDPEDA